MSETKRIVSFDVGLRHLAFAVLLVDDECQVTLERWEVVDVLSGMEKGKSAPDALTTAIVETLDREFYDPGSTSYDAILIENQPARKNPEMKGVQMAIHTYFATLRMYVGCVKDIHLVSAGRKLQTQDAGKKASYRERKALSVELGRKALVEMGDEAALEKLARTKKKDDLCDALLQGLEWIKPSKRTRAKKIAALPNQEPT